MDLKPNPNETITDPEEYVSKLFSFALHHIPDHYYIGLSIQSGYCNTAKVEKY